MMEPDLGGLTIWLALNDDDLCMFLTDYMRHKGCMCRCFGHCLALSEALSHQTPSLLINDEDFAGKTTPQLVQWLAMHVPRRAGMIFVSRASLLHHQQLHHLRQVEHSTILHHPFTTSELVAALQTVIGVVYQPS